MPTSVALPLMVVECVAVALPAAGITSVPPGTTRPDGDVVLGTGDGAAASGNRAVPPDKMPGPDGFEPEPGGGVEITMCGWLASTLGMIAVMIGAGRPETIDSSRDCTSDMVCGRARRILLQHLTDQRFQRRLDFGNQRRQPRRRLDHVGDHHLAGAGPHERRPAGHHLEQDAAERVDVGAVVDRARVARLLRRHVRRRSQHAAGAGLVRVAVALLDTSFAMPKSRILIATGVRAEPSVARKRLSGLRSRWTMPRSCAADSALAT